MAKSGIKTFVEAKAAGDDIFKTGEVGVGICPVYLVSDVVRVFSKCVHGLFISLFAADGPAARVSAATLNEIRLIELWASSPPFSSFRAIPTFPGPIDSR